MSGRSPSRLRWFLIGVLCAVSTCAAAYWAFNPPTQPVLSDEQRRVLIEEHGFEPAEVVEKIVYKDRFITKQKPYPVPVEVEKIVHVEVPGEPVEVVREVIREVPVNLCAEDEIWLAGDCQVEIVGTGRQALARGLWSCEASGEGWTASRGPILADEVSFQITEKSPESRLKRALWAGPSLTTEGYGGMVGYSIQGNKWGLMAQAGWVRVEESSFLSEFEAFFQNTGSEPVAVVMIGREF